MSICKSLLTLVVLWNGLEISLLPFFGVYDDGQRIGHSQVLYKLVPEPHHPGEFLTSYPDFLSVVGLFGFSVSPNFSQYCVSRKFSILSGLLCLLVCNCSEYSLSILLIL